MSRHDATSSGAMQIGITGFSDGERPFAFIVPASDLELEEFTGEVRAEGVLRKVGMQHLLTGTATGTYAYPCDRCLANTERMLTAELAIYYGDTVTGEDDDAELRTLHTDQTTIVMDDDVREALLTEIPLKFLCSEDCKGICAGCGVNLNAGECRCQSQAIDPRWAKLAELLGRDDQETTNN